MTEKISYLKNLKHYLIKNSPILLEESVQQTHLQEVLVMHN